MPQDAVEAAIASSFESIPNYTAPDEGDVVDEGGDPEPVAEVAATPEAAPVQQTTKPDQKAVEAVEDKLAVELGINPKVKNNRIPYDRVQAIVANREKALVTQVAKHFGISEADAAKLTFGELDTVFDTHYTKKVKGFEDEVTRYKSTLDEIAAGEHIMENDADRFMEALAFKYPDKYKKYVDAVNGTQQTQRQSGQPDPDAMPGPNITLADGSKSYDMDGFQAVLNWQAGQFKKQLESAVADVRKEYEPVAKAHRAQEVNTQAANATMKMISDARQNWEGFADNEKEILEAFRADPSLSVRDAWQAVRTKKLQAELAAAKEASTKAEQTAREKLMKEMGKADVVDTSISAGGPKPTTTAPQTIEDAIRASLAKIK